jgi:hypothetical protein
VPITAVPQVAALKERSMGYGHDKKVSEDEVKAAMKTAALPLPAPRDPDAVQQFDPDRVPAAPDLLAPGRPSMTGASADVLLSAINETVDALYDKVLKPKRDEIRAELAKVPPPQAPDWVTKIVEAVIESIATATLGKIGSSAVGLIEQHIDPAADATRDAAKVIAKYAGAAAGKHAGRSAAGSTPQGGFVQFGEHTSTGQTALDEFFDRLDLRSVANQLDAKSMLGLISTKASQHVRDLAKLADDMRNLITDTGFVSWYIHEVTTQWMNFRARIDLGPRDAGQATDLYGANSVGAVIEGGTKATRAWRGPHAGFVDITVDVSGPSPSFLRANVVDIPGGARMLHDMSLQVDGGGVPYSLGTLPVYRRIWLRTAEGAFNTNPAFVVTPEGAIEANFDDPTLARVGSASGASAGGVLPMVGAHAILQLLDGVSTEQLQ